jgi:hypothetical protein
VLLFISPAVSIFDRVEMLFGVPALYVFLFVAWAVVIAAITWIVERGSG